MALAASPRLTAGMHTVPMFAPTSIKVSSLKALLTALITEITFSTLSKSKLPLMKSIREMALSELRTTYFSLPCVETENCRFGSSVSK